MQQVGIIGPGRVGQAMGRLLLAAGVPVRLVAARRPEAARRAVRFIGGGKPVAIDSPALADARILLIATSDGAIKPVAERLAQLRRDWSGRTVLHTCGSLPAAGPRSVLGALHRRGAAVGSLHPFQTIPSPEAGTRSLVGCYWAVEGDRAAVRLASQWVKSLRGVAFRLRPDRKTLYHAAAALTCPTVITLMDGAERLLALAGVPAKIARPMLTQFVAQTAKHFGALGGRRALTGPASRGDFATLARHLAALRRHAPDLLPAYRELVRSTLKLAGRRAPRRLG
jgi:predicted short-subunit dehydrogenase-like oxidoreductase (DUF2520 family)